MPENPKANKLAQKCCLLLLEINVYSISGPSPDEMKCITHTYTIQHNLQLFVHRGNVKGNNGVDEIINMKYWAVPTSLLAVTRLKNLSWMRLQQTTCDVHV